MLSTSYESWDGGSPEVVELDLSGSTPKAADLLREAPRVRFLLDDAQDPDDGDRRDPPPPPGEYRSGLLALLAYTAGPFAPLFMRQGTHTALWTFVALLAIASWVSIVWRWTDLGRMLEQGIVPLLPWLFTLCSVTLLGIAAWCRAIYLAGVDRRFVPERLPGWLRHPVGMAGVALVAPGLGHLASGHPRRAACAFWNAAVSALAIFALAWAGWLWGCNRSAGAGGLPDLAFETLFIVCATLASLGVLLWIGSALDGVRLYSMRTLGRSSLRGDWLSASLLATVVLLLVTLQPVELARQLDQFSGAMRFAGFRMIPLGLETAASHLDPAEPKYRMQVAELFETLGKNKSAQDIRERLRARWDTYAEQLLREELHEGEELVPLPIDIAIETADSTAALPVETP